MSTASAHSVDSRHSVTQRSNFDVEDISYLIEHYDEEGKRKRDSTTSQEIAGPNRGFKSARLATDEDDISTPAHSPSHERLFASMKLPYGVLYEIARFASTKGSGYETLDKTRLPELQGLKTADAVAKVPALFGIAISAVDEASTRELAAKAPWKELDLEDEHLARDTYSGLGLSLEAPDWFGGKVHFLGKISKDGKSFKVSLKQAELGPSDRFARRWGSSHFLTLNLSKDVLNQGPKLVKFLSRPFALGRSNSAPVLRLEEVCIHNIPDIGQKSSLFPPSGLTFPVVSEQDSDMTDGAGLINKAALRLIHHRLDMERWPTAIQCRVVGAKGLLVMHPNNVDETPTIWIRPSQIKVKHTQHSDPTLRTIDMLRSSHAQTRCRLPVETIINLAENGVPASAFMAAIEEAVVTALSPLVKWDGSEDAMLDLWVAVCQEGGVMPARAARKDTVLARLKGYSETSRKDKEEEDDDEDLAEQPSSTAWWVDQTSGCPSSLEETVLYLLDSGFKPQDCSVLREKLSKVVDNCVKRYIDSFRIDLPIGMSAMAFLVPDELGVLGEGEFFFKSSRHDLQTGDGMPTDILIGPALITRHPYRPMCRRHVPVHFALHDVKERRIQWTAVDKPELRHFTDVIVLSTKGPRRAADFLSGGDYDGDKGLLVWHPSFVDPHLTIQQEPVGVASAFSPNNELVAEFLERTRTMTPAQQLSEMQAYLLSAVLNISVVGKYSNWHLNALYTLGYRDPETIRLAYMFCKTLDGAKTGLTVLPQQFEDDRRKYDKRPPKWREAEKKKNQDSSNLPHLTRDTQKLGPFIMDILYRHSDKTRWGTTWGQELKADIDRKFKGTEHVVDQDLVSPWLQFVERDEEKQKTDERRRATVIMLATHTLSIVGLPENDRHLAEEALSVAQNPPLSDRELILEHVRIVSHKHKQKIGPHFTKLPIEKRQDILRELSRDFASNLAGLKLEPPEAARLKASCAYWYDSDSRAGLKRLKWSRFPWDVAFREARAHLAIFGQQVDSCSGKVRLSKWFTTTAPKAKAKIVKDVTQLVLARRTRMCNFLEYKDTKVVYRRYASLFFVTGISSSDNELVTLEIIHRYVEVLDRYFGNVCELDLIFNFQKAYAILDELIISGELQESSKKSVLRVVTQSDTVEEQETSEDSMARLGSRSG
ncbi:unnamed protein product [Mycena citricolor]|uniref:RNA-dependent RNA polymerase n=1 Tax=Mycena citricolor TaxID=2018698 RepID=A0AAD2HGS3_9AGAR|nr:unnamed protein product [Mycena citricolor]